MTSIRDVSLEDIKSFLVKNDLIIPKNDIYIYDYAFDIIKKGTNYYPDSVIEWIMAHNLINSNVEIRRYTKSEILSLSQNDLEKLTQSLTMKSNNIDNVINILNFMHKIDPDKIIEMNSKRRFDKYGELIYTKDELNPFQLHRLSKNEYDMLIRKYYEIERKYLKEFDIIECKNISRMSEFTNDELKLWKDHLNNEYYPGVSDNVKDLFDQNDIENHGIYEILAEDISIVKWNWNHNGRKDILIDIYDWPGDNQSGSIFLNDKIILKNGDAELYEDESTPLEMINRIPSFQHLRTFDCTEEDNREEENGYNLPEHKYCASIKKKRC